MTFVLVIYFVSGAQSWANTYPNWSILQVVAAYAGLGLGLGTFWGVVRPFMHSWWGAAMVGAVIFSLFEGTFTGLASLVDPVVLAGTIPLGSIAGIVLWYRFKGRLPN